MNGRVPALRILSLLGLLAAACGADAAPPGPADQTLTASGTVETLPHEGSDRREIAIAHDAIPDFRDREGAVVGMDAMTMQFELADGISLAGVSPGDRVRFTFEVRWDARPMLYVTALRAL
jgi:Cu/Ag efflux protein CusF